MKRLAATIAVILAVFAAPAAAWAQNNALVRFSFSAGWDALPALVALERGLFDQEQLVVSGLAVTNPAAVINSLAAGSTDFALVPQRVLLVMAGAKAPVTVIAGAGRGTQMELVTKRGVKASSLNDLKGKRIAVNAGSEALPVLMRLLNRQKMRASDVKVLRLSSQQITQAFDENLADAVFETRHFTSTLVRTQNGSRVMSAADVVKSIGYVGAVPLVASNRVIEREPEVVQRFVTAWVKAMAYIRQDPDDAARILQVFFHRQGVKVSTETAKEWVRMSHYDLYTWSKQAVADAEYNGWGLKAGGILKTAPKLDGYINNSFAEKAVRTVGLR